MMMLNTCINSNTSKYSHLGQVKLPFNIPNDPRRKCKSDCSSQGKNNDNNAQPKKKIGVGGKKHNATKKLEKLPSSDSDLSFVQVGNNDNFESRVVHYKEPPGSSFGAHLLRKSIPMYAHALDEKLKFKRDSDAGNIITQQQRKISKPFFMNEVDSDEVVNLRNELELKNPECSLSRPVKRNMVHNQFLTTSNRAKEGLKYVMATNFPHIPPDPPTGSPPVKHEIQDICGRKSHHPKLRARDLGKRLCEAPSMTEELDELYKEYNARCPEGDVQNEACRFLHHAPSPVHREPRRSILKEHASVVDFHQEHRRSSGRGHLVRFDKEVDLISAGLTKVNGMDASLRETNARLKLLRQLGGRITAIGTQVDESHQERYPLHVKDPKKTIAPAGGIDWLKVREEEDLEEKTAKQDLARIYFTTEATRLVACANLPSLERNTNTFKKMDISRRPPFPHFFMDRLAEDVEVVNKRKKEQRLTAIKNEMDAFDESLKGRPATYTIPNFDPLHPSSEKSLNDLKLKVEIMKRQRERDVQAATVRNRTRKSYFRKMLPCLADVLKDDLMNYSIKIASRLSGEEMILAGDLLLVAKQRNVLEEHRRKYEEDEELLTEEVEEMPGENEKFIKDILEVCLDVVFKTCNYKATTGKDPSESLRREWRDVGFSLINQQHAGDDQAEEVADIICGAEGSSEDDTGSQTQLRLSNESNESVDETKDASESGKDEGDDNRATCIVALKTVTESTPGRTSIEGKPATTTVQVQVTDCVHEDIESALTYDGLFLPVTESHLTQSTSETQTESSASPSATPTDSADDSFTDCLNVNQANASKQHLGGFDYEEYGGEDEEYFDANGVMKAGSRLGTTSLGRIESELTEETGTDSMDGPRVGEVEIQKIDYSEGDSPDGGKQKGKGLQFNEVVDAHAVSSVDIAGKGKSLGESKTSVKDSLKFSLPQNFVSKRKPVQRKPTSFRPKPSVDDDDDDDDDDNQEVLENDELIKGKVGLSSQGEDGEGMDDGEELENLEEAEEQGDENDTGSSRLAHSFRSKKTTEKCSGPSKRKTLVYDELGNISYGMNWNEHEKRFLKHRFEELKELSETWFKGLHKPPNIYTTREKNFVPFSKQLTGKRKPPFNILDPTINRPKFNLRVKNLIRKAEQARLTQNVCIEDTEILQQEVRASSGHIQVTEPKPVKRTCSEMLKGKPKKRPSWQEEIAEYECRRKEREKLMAASKVVEDPAKELGFDAFYNASSLRRTFIHREHSHVHIVADAQLEEHEEEQESGNTIKKSSLARKKTPGCTSSPEGTLPDSCEVEVEETGGLEEEVDAVENLKCDEQEECQQFTTKYMEIPGEGFYDLNLDFPLEKDEEDRFSIQDVYNE